MGTYVALAFLLLVSAVLSRSGAQSQSPSLTDFAAFCNEIASSGGAPNPFIEVLCRQVAERGVSPAPSNATSSWNRERALNASQEATTAATDPSTALLAQQPEQVTEKLANDSEVVPQETNNPSESNSRDSSTLNATNGLPSADNLTAAFPVREGQSVIVLNHTFPKQQVDLEVSGGSVSNAEVASVDEKSNRSAVQPENKLRHLQLHNVTTLYVGQRAQSEVLGGYGLTGQNVTRTLQTYLKTVKRGDQMPVPENQTGVSPAVGESSTNQTYKQQSLDEGGLSIQQSDVQNSEKSTINQSTGIIHVVETERKNATADRSNATEDSTSEGLLYMEETSTIATTESEAFSTTEVARDSLHSSPGSNMTGTEIQGTGHGSTGNGSSAQFEVNNFAQVTTQAGLEPEIIKDGPSNLNGVSKTETSQNIPVLDKTQSTTGVSSAQEGAETNLPTGNEKLNSETGTRGGQSAVEQGMEGIPQDTVSVITQPIQGEGDYTTEIQSAVDLTTDIVDTTESTTFNTESVVVDTETPALTNGEESTGQLPVIVGENFENYNQSGVSTTNVGITTIVASSNVVSEQDTLGIAENGAGGGQETLVTKPEIPTSQSVAVDLSQQVLPGITEVSNAAGLDGQNMNEEHSLAKGGNSSDLNINSSTQQLEVSGTSSAGTTNQVSIGVSSSTENSVNSTLLAVNASETTGQLPDGVSSSEGNSDGSPSVAPNPSGPTGQLATGVSNSEGSSAASPEAFGSTSQNSAGVSYSEGNSFASTSNDSGSISQPSEGELSSEGNSAASPSLPPNPSGSASQLPAGDSASEGNTVSSPSFPLSPSGVTSQPSAGTPTSEENSAVSPSLPPNTSKSAGQPSVGVSATEGSSVAFPSLPPKPDGSTSQPTTGVSSSEGSSAAPSSFPPTSEGDSMLVLRELSTEILGGLAEVHCRNMVNDFWKNVTEVFRRVSASHKPTVSDVTSMVTGLIESYRRESPYWATIAARLEEATSDSRWRQLVATLLVRRRGDPVSQLRLLRASRQLREAVRAAVSTPECRLPGASPAADSCERFVLCYRAGWAWRSLTLSCPRGSAFSSSERRCVWRPLARCAPVPSFGGWIDDDGDSDSDSDSDSSDSDNSEERSWSLFGHGHSLFRMFH